MKTIIAIDPGASGGIAVWSGWGKPSAQSFPIPDTGRDIIDTLEAIDTSCSIERCEVVVVMEQQTFCAGMAVSAPAMGKFGRGVGFLEGVAQTLRFRLEHVTPQQWIKDLGLGKRDKSLPRTAWKNKLKARAQELFPDQKVTLKTCDALLILEWYRRQNP